MDGRLRVLSGPHAGESFHVERGKLLIGREEDCDLRSDSDFVSRHHCVLLLDDYALRVRDLGSKNGTYVNGRRIGSFETVLMHDDMISIGEMICQVDLMVPAASSSSAEALSMSGTGVFGGETVQTQSSVPKPDSQLIGRPE